MDFFPFRLFVVIVIFDVVQKQAIPNLDTSCYTGVPKKGNQEFAETRTLLSLTDVVKKFRREDIGSPTG